MNELNTTEIRDITEPISGNTPSVWIMNLKDNREVIPEDLDKSKFEFCKGQDIVGIGWAGMDAESTEDVAFSQASRAIYSFEPGDLVWVKDPASGCHYLCKIKEKAVKTDDPCKNKHDIGTYCSCDYAPVSVLPEGIEEQDLIARHTIERANETVTEKTVAAWNDVCAKSEGQDGMSSAEIGTGEQRQKKKSILKPIIIIAACIVALTAVILLIPTFNRMIHPLLPKGLKFGMTFDEIRDTTDYLNDGSDGKFSDLLKAAKEGNAYSIMIGASYRPFDRTFRVTSSVFDEIFAQAKPLNMEESKIFSVEYLFNDQGELYGITVTATGDPDTTCDFTEQDFDTVCHYLEKAVGDITIETDNNEQFITGNNNGIVITGHLINETGLTLNITIKSEAYKPVIPE